jgi:hypothetical protein
MPEDAEEATGYGIRAKRSKSSAEPAAIWASKALNAKNSLITADARLAEDAFRDKIASFEDENGDSENVARLLRRPEQSGAAQAAQSSAVFARK